MDATDEVEADFDLSACEQLMRGGSKTFFAASKVLPDRVRGPATALYAFCRLADDTIDVHSADHGGPAGAMAHLHQRLDRLYAGRPMPVDADRALAVVVKRFHIPRALLLALLDGFQWDMDERRYQTLADLHGYAARVAGTVGAMMALIMGARSPQALARACELGVAMQLTNIARDVGEDARLGRLYLPREWMRDAGLDPDAWLCEPSFSPALGSVVARLLRHADELYHRAELGLAELPRDCRAAIQAARLVYAEIGREVERRGCDSVTHRAVVPARRKLALLARASLAAVKLPRHAKLDDGELLPLPAIAYLVDAAAAPHAAENSPPGGVARVLNLFERQQQRHRVAHAFPGSGQPRPSVFSG
ncbi:MAG: phytoene synthase [Methylibium sp. NZG]|nr:MAG: phytoene synthase [Methylibium sp. NZG]